MKLLRIAFACSLLLLAAVPSFALPCEACTGSVYPYCEPSGNHTRCLIGIDTCQDRSAPSCTPSGQPPAAMLAEWTVASIEISRPAQAKTVVSSPGVVAMADVPQSAPQK